MICYKDKTFCSSDVKEHTCGREITQKEIAHAKEIGLPIAWMEFCNKKVIVKVQLSLATSHDKQQVLVYDEDHKNSYEGDASPEIIKAMDGEVKKFFYAIFPTKPGMIDMFEEAPWQDW